MPSPGPTTETMTGSPGRTPPPPPRPATLSQAEAGSAAAPASEREEQCKKARENLDVGAAVTVFGFAVLMGYISLPKEAKKHRGDVRLTVSFLLSFATFLCGKALTLLSLNMLGRQVLVSGGGHRAAAKCLVAACTVLPVLTLLSLLALLPGGVYLYAGLAVATATMLAAAGTHWYYYYYLSRSTERGGDVASGYDDLHKKEELDAASKVTSCVTNSAFGGLIGALFSASKVSGADAAADKAAHAAIFFLFATAILGTFVMTVLRSKITANQRCGGRRILVAAVRLANTLLLCSLACAAFAAAFVVLGYRIFAAFAPLAMAGVLCFLLRRCVPRRHGGDGGGGDLEENPEAGIKAMEDIASKVTAAALGGIMSVLGGALGGEKDRGKQWGSMDALMLVLTSAFVSGFGFMVLAAAPGSAKLLLAPVARVLVWSTVLLFSATAVAVYRVEAWTI